MHVGDSTCGQRAVYQMGMTGIPVYNVRLCVYMYQGVCYCIEEVLKLALDPPAESVCCLFLQLTDQTTPIDCLPCSNF